MVVAGQGGVAGRRDAIFSFFCEELVSMIWIILHNLKFLFSPLVVALITHKRSLQTVPSLSMKV